MVFHHPPGTTLNALSATQPEEPPDRTLRHLAMCRELAVLGMDMARAAHAARNEWAQPDAPPEPTPIPATNRPPNLHLPSTRPHADAPRRETASPSLAFARIVRAVEQIIVLEIRIAADQAAKARQAAIKAAGYPWSRPEPAPAQAATPATSPQQSPGQPLPPRSANGPDIPSLLATISREIGVDLEDPTLSSRLPSFQRATGPP